MKPETVTKTGLSALSAVLAYYTDKVTALIWLLILFEAADYITGIVAASMSKQLSSTQGFKGLIKKLCYFILVGVGFGVDYLVVEAVGLTGLELNYPAIFGVLTVCYLLSTEAISILENLGEMGIEVPFLSKLIKSIREKIVSKADKHKHDDSTYDSTYDNTYSNTYDTTYGTAYDSTHDNDYDDTDVRDTEYNEREEYDEHTEYDEYEEYNEHNNNPEHNTQQQP